MKVFKLISSVLLLVVCHDLQAQTWTDSILNYRQKYKEKFLTNNRSPLKEADTGWLRFYEPNPVYKVLASFELENTDKTFQIPTSDGRSRTFRKYGTLKFELDGIAFALEVYQNLDLLKNEKYCNHLFLPFKDLTNYESTYGGGRYIDLTIDDIADNTLVLDFNKAYNPWCAFGGGYSCPIPPDANKLAVEIPAGEKSFGREIDH